MSLSVGGGVEVRAVRIDEVEEVVVLERVDALELARMGVFCGRGRWWMSYALRFTGSFRISNASWT